MFWGLGSMPERFFKAKRFRYHAPKLILEPKIIFLQHIDDATMYECISCIASMYFMYVLHVCIACMYWIYLQACLIVLACLVVFASLVVLASLVALASLIVLASY